MNRYVLLVLLLSINIISCKKEKEAKCQVLFDGDKAFLHVEKLVSYGPRFPQSEEIKKARNYISSYLKELSIHVTHDTFTAITPKGPIDMENIIGVIPGDSKEVIIIGSHYDTKLYNNRLFLGANDGGSSTGTLLELGRVIKECNIKYPLTIWLVFFDGEEAIKSWSEKDSCYGSRRMIESLQKKGQLKNIKAMVLLDMIGDKDLNIKKEINSTYWLTDIIWEVARKQGYKEIFLSSLTIVEDDHIPFIKAGIPAVNIIDFEYGNNNCYWHTPQDTLDKLSPQSLKIVGDVILNSIPIIMKELSR